jgi:small subunit ribosomal protein S21
MAKTEYLRIRWKLRLKIKQRAYVVFSKSQNYDDDNVSFATRRSVPPPCSKRLVLPDFAQNMNVATGLEARLLLEASANRVTSGHANINCILRNRRRSGSNPRLRNGIHVQVLVRDNNVDQALRALKKKMQREGIFREMKMRDYYEKPSEKRAREKAEAVSRVRKLARKRMQREGLISGGTTRPAAASTSAAR